MGHCVAACGLEMHFLLEAAMGSRFTKALGPTGHNYIGHNYIGHNYIGGLQQARGCRHAGNLEPSAEEGAREEEGGGRGGVGGRWHGEQPR